MNHTTTHELVLAGHRLVRQLDRAHLRQARKPIPTRWPITEHINTIGDLVTAVEAFDARSDHLIRILMRTPADDTKATDTILVGLLGGAVHRHRHQPERIAEVITELALYIVERPGLRSQRESGNLLLDEANRRTRRAIGRQLRHNATIEYTDHEIDFVDNDNPESLAIARIELERCRKLLHTAGSSVDLDHHIALSTRRGNDIATRQRVSRNRRRLRSLIGPELGTAA